MKLKFRIFIAMLSLILVFPFGYSMAYADECYYLGGMPAGFSLHSRGAEIVGVCDVLTENGLCSPSKELGIQEGDIILKLDNYEINSAEDVKKFINNDQMILEYRRGEDIFIKTIKPAKDINGNYKIGVFIKDSISGIGTITFIRNNRFASLGHPVIDSDGRNIEISSGELYNCNINGLIKGERGKAGELRGTFVKNKKIGSIDKNIDSGVYGNINNNFDFNQLTKINIGNACLGDAIIYSTIDSEKPKEYAISIIKIDECGNKNFVIKILDKDLIEKTGGIVQGMSGSPIVQNGCLVGAVTHVFINDPSRGFGISINNMLNN